MNKLLVLTLAFCFVAVVRSDGEGGGMQAQIDALAAQLTALGTDVSNLQNLYTTVNTDTQALQAATALLSTNFDSQKDAVFYVYKLAHQQNMETGTVISWDGTGSDDSNFPFDMTTGVFTAPATGMYELSVCARSNGVFEVLVKTDETTAANVNNVAGLILTTHIAYRNGCANSYVKLASGSTFWAELGDTGSSPGARALWGNGWTQFTGRLVLKL